MNRKSFFRGFGVGVLFAALILGVSFMIRTSDSYVKSRARELGMVYANEDSDRVLASQEGTTATPEASPDAAKEGKETSKPENSGAPKSTEASKSTQMPKSTQSADKTASPATKKPSASAKPTQKAIDMKREREKMEKSIRDDAKNLTINAGDWSSDVCKKLEKLGIIKSATDFDKYLESHGYSSAITAGTYKVSKGDSYSQLAKKITGH